ncbi:hypothetical protein C7444_102186 [Sphaerotilus hippei]|uniref:Uncharacterized protein n=1 Tax=Sphaerotilus hippei TaxID=744406 RepID=A0A318H4U0_9BURK|nr:hypothetical protein [Sphaerotilus hippei]PXW98706.1 hypothetical protein C7444_102186 [Sphaerotilus hippei]
MPMFIEHIDAIARSRQRDVLMVTFGPRIDPTDEEAPRLDWEHLPQRIGLTQFLDQEGVIWQCCGPMRSDNGFGPYEGQIHIDIAYDPAEPRCRRILDRLEHPDGRMKDPMVSLWLMTLDLAMRNAHHDEPGFCNSW